MVAVVGSLSATLVADNSNLASGLRASGRDITHFERRSSSSFRRFDRQARTSFTGVGRHAQMAGASIMRAFAPLMGGVGLAALARNSRRVVSELSEMGKQMDRVGLSAKVFQELQFGFELAGVSASNFQTGLEQFTEKIGEASTRGNRLGEILKANGVALKDQAGNLRSNESLLRDYANLIKNAANENEQLVLATEAFGTRAGREFVTALRNGSDGLDDMARAAEDAGGTIDEALIRRAEELDDKFASLWRRFSINSRSAIMTAITWLDDLITKADAVGNHSFFRRLAEGMPTIGGAELTWMDPDLARAHGQPLGPDARIRDAFRTSAEDAITSADDALVKALQDRYGVVSDRAARTIIPGAKEGGGSSRGRAAEQALREAEAVATLIDNLEFERSLIGLTDVERAKATALRQAGAAATDEQRKQIISLTEAIHAEREAVEESRKAHEDRARAIESGMQMVFDGLMSVVDGSDSAEEALKRLVKQLALAVAQAALLGNGPLSGIFGGGGGILRMLLPGVLHTGGDASQPPAFRAVAAPRGPIPRFHSGRKGPGANEMLALLEKTETVLTDDHTARISGVLSSALASATDSRREPVEITVNVEGANGDAHVMQLVQKGVSMGLDTYDKSQRRGGIVANQSSYNMLKKR